jgi:type I restriction enzyme, S subunit
MREWCDIAFGDLAEPARGAFSMGPFGSKITKENYVQSGVPVVRGGNLARGIFVDMGFVYIAPEKADELVSANVKSGDLIFTHRGTIGQVSMIPRKSKFPRYVIGSSQVKCRLDESISVPEFYYYWFRSPQGQHSILSHTSTVGVPGIATPLTTIRGLRVPFPPRVEQQAIAEVLGALDDKIALNERIRETVLSLGRSLLEREVRESGAAVKLGDVAELVYGKALPLPDRREGSVPVFGCTGQVGWHDTALTENPYPVVGRKGANAGHVSWMSRPGWIIDTAFYARPMREGMTSEGLYFILDAADIGSLIGDSAVPGVNRNAVLDHRILVPDPGKMTLFARQAHSLLATAEQTTNENRTLADLRDTLLPQLLSGKLRVKDAVRTVEEAV